MNHQQQLEYFADPFTAQLGEHHISKLARVQLRPVEANENTRNYFRYKKNAGDAIDDGAFFGYFVDGKQLTLSDCAGMVQCVGSYHAVTHGIRIVDVSEAECELYGRTDLHGVSAKEWHQSYPLIIVRLPPSVFPHLIGVVSLPQVSMNCNLFTFPARGIIDHVYVGDDFELALSSPNGVPARIPVEVGRMAINAVMHLANYPDLYGRYSSASNRITVRRNRRDGGPKRCDLIPQIISLKSPLAVEGCGDTTPGDGGCEGEQAGKRPHWRRGHWRRVAFGPGRTERRHAWFKPVLVNGRHLASEAKTLVLYRD